MYICKHSLPLRMPFTNYVDLLMSLFTNNTPCGYYMKYYIKVMFNTFHKLNTLTVLYHYLRLFGCCKSSSYSYSCKSSSNSYSPCHVALVSMSANNLLSLVLPVIYGTDFPSCQYVNLLAWSPLVLLPPLLSNFSLFQHIPVFPFKWCYQRMFSYYEVINLFLFVS